MKMKAKFITGLAAAMMLTVGASTIFPPIDAQASTISGHTTIVPPSHTTISPAAADPYDPVA